jgi:hypothetical protein
VVGSRVRNTARRAVRQGVLRVDLVSLRRDRGRALSDLGVRAMRAWAGPGTASLETDAEAIRLRALIRSIEDQIAAKEAEAATLRQAARPPAPAASEGQPNE